MNAAGGVIPAEVSTLAVLQFGTTQLLLPQNEVAILELIADLQPSVSPGVVGELSFQGNDWPVYNLDDQLRLAGRLPRSRRLCALLHAGAAGAYVGLACDEVGYLERGEVQMHAVPRAMCSEPMLVSTIAVDGEKLQWATTVADLENWLARQEDGLYAH